jgi:hypothetical protein
MENLELKQWSLGRFNFSLPEQLYLAGRNQSIYEVEVSTVPLENQSADSIWKNHLEKIKSENSSTRYPEGIIWTKEVNPGFYAVSYQKDTSVHAVTVKGQAVFGDHLLLLKYSGKLGMEDEILRLISITAGGYRVNDAEGFNVGYGSITSEPGINEHAFASFKNDQGKTEVTINTQTPGKYLSDHPLENISHEIKGIEMEGGKLKVLRDDRRTVADFRGYEGLVIVESPDEDPIFRYTWFFQGETGNAFKPEILIKMIGPSDQLEIVKETWENLLKSLTIRK